MNRDPMIAIGKIKLPRPAIGATELGYARGYRAGIEAARMAMFKLWAESARRNESPSPVEIADCLNAINKPGAST